MSKDFRPKILKNENFLHLSETRVSGKCIFDGSFLKMHSDVVISSDGCRASRDYAVHPGAVAVLPFLDKSTLLLERQWRYPLNRSLYESILDFTEFRSLSLSISFKKCVTSAIKVSGVNPF